MKLIKMICGYATLVLLLLAAGVATQERLFAQTGCSKCCGCAYNLNEDIRDSTDCPGECYWKDCGLFCAGCNSYNCWNDNPCPCCTDQCYGYGSCTYPACY